MAGRRLKDKKKKERLHAIASKQQQEVNHQPSVDRGFSVSVGAFLRRHVALIVVMIVTFVWEFVLWRHAQPNVFPDGWTYGMLGKELLAGNFSHELFSFRTPGFPGFLAMIFAIAGPDNWQAVVNVQFLLGAWVPVGLYALFLPFAGRPWLAAMGAAAYLLDRHFLALQAVPLTEFLGGVLGVYVLAWHVWAWKRCYWQEAVLLGFATGLWILVRPSFQLLPWCLLTVGLILSWWDLRIRQEQPGRTLRWHAAYVVGWQLPLLLWSANVYRFTGHWGLSHQLGASLTNHTGAFMEYAPAEAGPLRDLYVAEKQRRGGDWINIFDSIHKQLEAATSSPIWEVSLRYKEINKVLLTKFWREYLDQVQIAWNMLWREASKYVVDESATGIDPKTGRGKALPLFEFVSTSFLGRNVYLPLDRALWYDTDTPQLIPKLLVVLLACLAFLRRRDRHALLALLVIVGTVFYHMLIHAAVQFTEFGRYRLPVQPLWWGFLFCGIAVVLYESLRSVHNYFEKD
ncbi:MAG: hypothetical protein ACPL7D_04310 [Candidatus Sumerlaeaceae bacterium]|jgi:hypothetical protein